MLKWRYALCGCRQVKKDMEVAYSRYVQQAKQAQEVEKNVDKFIAKQAAEARLRENMCP